MNIFNQKVEKFNFSVIFCAYFMVPYNRTPFGTLCLYWVQKRMMNESVTYSVTQFQDRFWWWAFHWNVQLKKRERISLLTTSVLFQSVYLMNHSKAIHSSDRKWTDETLETVEILWENLVFRKANKILHFQFFFCKIHL